MDGPPRWSPLPVGADDLALAANDDRRIVLSILSTGGAVTTPALATAVAAAHRGVDSETITAEERRRRLLALDHVHLPILVDGGVVSADRERTIVEPAESPLFEEPLASLVDPDSGVPTAVFDALANSRRLATLKALHESGGSLSLAELAARVLAVENGCSPDDPSDSACTACQIDLHHRHVPRLAEVDLVEWNGRNSAVRVAEPLPEPLATALGVSNASVRSSNGQ